MSDKLIVGKVVFSENDSKTTEACKVYISPPGRQRGVRHIKKADIRPEDTAQRCHEIGLLRILAVKYPRIVKELMLEKSFDTASESP